LNDTIESKNRGKGMKKSKMFGCLLQAGLFSFVLFSNALVAGAALAPGATYTVKLSKVNSNGTTTAIDSTTATADTNGKLSFSFSSVPTSPATNFLVLTLLDGSNTVVRKSFVPAPPEGGTGKLGLNSLSTVQTNMVLAALQGAGTDDPIVAAYGLILTRTPDMTANEADDVATLGRLAIRGPGGFEDTLLNNGVTAAQLATFKQKLIYNQPNKDLSNFTALFKSAVDNPDQATDDMSLAAGMIADIFIDAGVASDIDLSLILAGHDAAGDVVQNNPTAAAAFANFGTATSAAIDQSMSNFNMRIKAVKLKASYSSALTTLGASGAQVTQFNTAVQDLMTNMQNLDKQYGPYYEDPSTMTDTIRSQMNQDYSAVFDTFQTAIAATNQDISDMKAAIAAALGIDESTLPPDVGTYFNMNSQTVNWPIPQVVATDWVAGILQAGGSVSYDRTAVASALPVPANMSWLNGTGTRSDFSGMPLSFAALMQVQEDMQIAEMTRDYIYDSSNPDTSGNPTGTQKQTATVDYAANVKLIMTSLSGTTDGSTLIGTDKKQALLKLMEHPNF
jgi:hypothetical protein